MKKPALSATSIALALVVAAYGCGDDSGDGPEHDGAKAGAAGARPSGGKGGVAGSGGAVSGGAPAAGTGNRSSEDGGAGGDGGEFASSGAPGSSAGAAGSGGAAGAGGSPTEGGAPAAGAGGGPSLEDPRCAEIPADATVTSHLRITADNECDVFVNGSLVGSTNNWGAAVTIDVSLYVHPGRKNVVAVVGRNTSSQLGNDRGIIGQLTTTVDEVTTPIIVTDASWRVAQEPVGDWTLLDYDDSAWPPAAEIADADAPPWGGPLGVTDAKWIWFAPVPESTQDKPNEEATYTRRVFYFDFDGAPADEPSCAEPSP